MEMIRVQEIILENFKNIERGSIEFGSINNMEDFFEESKILGIYGQNGSGKTSIIEGMEIIKLLLSGDKLPHNTLDFISKGKDNMTITITLLVENEHIIKLLEYSVNISKKLSLLDDKEILIPEISEILKLKEYKDDSWTRKKILIQTSGKNIKPIGISQNLDLIELTVAKKLSEKSNSSFIFSNDLIELIIKNKSYFKELIENINFLKKYGKRNLYIINNREISLINTNIMIPLNFRYEENNSISQGVIPIYLNESTFLKNKEFKIIQGVIEKMNIALESLIPNLNINIIELEKGLTKNMEEGVYIKLTSKKGDLEIPLEYESDGIKKIVSILGTLIATYNDPNFNLFIDEFDATIFEYLLGEILQIMEKFAQGQLVFTSHNLRPLEVLEPRHLRFTITDSNNKYIKIPNVKATNNLRNIYFKEIFLDEKKLGLYKGNSNSKIRKSFSRAGGILHG
ncbi:AAA family ATPase [Cetobacterium sp. SF1]|uniref:AAA family ATPase n=1 Tax=Cetobacterium sp. SF1 TaxID=3417654 RepID=UPI003CF03C2C